MDRSFPVTGSRGDGTCGEAAQVTERGLARHRRRHLEEVAHKRAEQPDLVDRLVCVRVTQMMRPIRRQYQERGLATRRFDDRRKHIGCRGTRSGHDDRRTSRSLADAQCEESSGALIEMDSTLEPIVAGERHDQRGRPRARSNDDLADATARKFVAKGADPARCRNAAIHV